MISQNDETMFDLDKEKHRMREYAELMLTHGPRAKNEEERLLYREIREVLDSELGGRTEKGVWQSPFDSHHDILEKTIRDLCESKVFYGKFRFHSTSTKIRSIRAKEDETSDRDGAIHEAIEKVDSLLAKLGPPSEQQHETTQMCCSEAPMSVVKLLRKIVRKMKRSRCN